MNPLYRVSPCLCCTRVSDPENCENKGCVPWRKWFLARWEILHAYPRWVKEQKGEPAGVCIGGQHYAPPGLLEGYLQKDPCDGCVCTWEQCTTPCRARQRWVMVKREVAHGLEA